VGSRLRGGTGTVWWTGQDRASVRGAANLADQSFVRAGGPKSIADEWPDLDDGWGSHAPVGSFAPNAFGLYDVHGNVWEWCRDIVGKDTGTDYTIPRVRATGSARCPRARGAALRGGCWNVAVSRARSAYRYFGEPSYRDDIAGVRPARPIAGEAGHLMKPEPTNTERPSISSSRSDARATLRTRRRSRRSIPQLEPELSSRSTP
jgi:formylglycine-generating enzyme required for sulfatase activity